ncbi:TetR/AcrR family transcriptional regulator [Nocardia beijingensis]|uniref:TetR/AcrR family transcriptional regulator n=1 Tax=Nocardia beijingensis TaxID=95162 RepID=UPI001894C491|nr:TetR family transcriptional regulator [Nocardia beijingensis]MBF6074505.1 TetR family transcriptional regulator [Nocardia beijingensis]
MAVGAGRGPRGERGAQADRILAVARKSFAERGYNGTSLRSVARDADVDPTLVNYYFSNKAGLLKAALEPPEAFGAGIAEAARVPLEERGRAFVEAALRMWDDPATSEVLRSIILAASHEPFAMERLRSVFSALVLQVVSASLPHDEAELRSDLVATQIVGLAMTRYVWGIDRIAAMPSEQVVRLIAPTVQHYLTGALGEDIHDHERPLGAVGVTASSTVSAQTVDR